MGCFLRLFIWQPERMRALPALEDRAKRADACQSFQERTGVIADHLRQLDQTALFIFPGEQDDEPVLQQQSNELGIQFTEDPPLVRRLPFINPSVLLPQLIEHLHLPPFPQEHKRFLQTEQVSRRRGSQDRPIC